MTQPKYPKVGVGLYGAGNPAPIDKMYPKRHWVPSDRKGPDGITLWTSHDRDFCGLHGHPLCDKGHMHAAHAWKSPRTRAL